MRRESKREEGIKSEYENKEGVDKVMQYKIR
jgi:hypothetical protein